MIETVAASAGHTTVRAVHAEPGADLAGWLDVHRAAVEQALHADGAILLRGFGTDSLDAFRRVRDRLLGAAIPYGERSTPRSDRGHNVYSSTEHPQTEAIALHNESSYRTEWPGVLVFACLTAPATGGATPLADTRAVLRELDEQIVDEFARRDWLLVRNYSPGVGLRWEEAFGTTRRSEVDEYCRASEVEPEWGPDGGLRTRQVRPAVARHPVTGETVWFNHVRFFNSAALDPEVRELLVLSYGRDGLPYETYFGDGEPIDPETVGAIGAAYDAHTAAFPWQAGDVLVVDNMLMAHGREPYSGPREVVVSMGTPRVRAGIEPATHGS